MILKFIWCDNVIASTSRATLVPQRQDYVRIDQHDYIVTVVHWQPAINEIHIHLRRS